jgi:CBS domain-containing protein
MHEPGIGTLVTFNPASVYFETPLAELAQRLLDCGFHHWPVLDADRRVVGILSDADIARHFSARAAARAASNKNSAAPPREMRAFDIMSARVTVIEMSTSWQTALATLVEQQVHSLPVVDDGVLIGIVTSSDFLREYSQNQMTGSRQSVAAFMTKASEPIEADTDLDTARTAMLASGHTHLAVVKGECPLGVISRRTLHMARCAQLVREAMHGDKETKPMLVRELIRTAPTVKPGDRLGTAAHLMVDFGVQAVAVVNQAHRLLGVVSEDELLRAMLSAQRESQSQKSGVVHFRTCSK